MFFHVQILDMKRNKILGHKTCLDMAIATWKIACGINTSKNVIITFLEKYVVVSTEFQQHIIRRNYIGDKSI